MQNAPAIIALHWWAPLQWEYNFWDVAEDEMSFIASYYQVGASACHPDSGVLDFFPHLRELRAP